ncbi:MAG TPA: PfkB family carbohydrate kinase [Actinomycetota bacterium]|jgi:ribokinase|nr:PfkB family carbohydrate kinase [Actinomycetota bacterium]
MTRVAVVGHVEWLTFARVEAVPPVGGIAHATETWAGAGGGGGVGAVQLARLAGSCDLFTAFGDDEVGRRATEELETAGVTVHARRRPEPSREAVCLVDRDGERTITTLGPRLEPHGADPLPWELFEAVDAVYVTAGDDDAIRRARAAAVLIVSTRHLGPLIASGVRADAVVGSARDPLERYDPSALAHAPPELVVLTEGREGGRFETAAGTRGRFRPAPLSGPISDTYGAGDSFQAGLTFGLGIGLRHLDALALAARCGAAALTGRGPTGGQLTAADL